MADDEDDSVVLCLYCEEPSVLPEIFDPYICETCMNVHHHTGVWPTGS